MSARDAGEPTDACRRFWISGRVQGVYFRASARERARTLGLRGWARNLDDGRVEVVASGSAAALQEFAAWLAQGPTAARVETVASEVVEIATPADFEIR